MKNNAKLSKRLMSVILATAMLFAIVPMSISLANAPASAAVHITSTLDNQFVETTDGTLVMYHEMIVENFDLSSYPYLTDTYGYTYDPTQPPTMLHLFIRLHELHDSINNFSFSADSPNSGWLMDFLGLGSNIMYFLNDTTPLNADGWASTADTITLADGDRVNAILYSSADYYYNARYSYFATPYIEANASESIELELGSLHIFDFYEPDYVARPEPERALTISNSPNTSPTISTDFDYTTDASGIAVVCLDTPGTYYISADIPAVEEIAPPLCVIVIRPTESQTPEPAASSYWPSFRGSDNNMAIVDAQTPTLVATEKFMLHLSTSWIDTLCQPIIVDNNLIMVVGNKLMKFDINNGEQIMSVDMEQSTSYVGLPPTYADNMIFVPMIGGMISAFDLNTFELLWTYTFDASACDSTTHITYSDGYIYTGFYSDSISDTDEDAFYVCIDVTDIPNTCEEKTHEWAFASENGYYFAGAYVDNERDTVIFGSECGQDGISHVYSVNRSTGMPVDSIEVAGNVRCSIAYDDTTSGIAFVTSAGAFFNVKLNTDGTFDKESLRSLDLGNASTSTPVIYNSRAYVGVQAQGLNSGKIAVIDMTNMSLIYDVDMPGYPQCSMLLSTGYDSYDGTVYIYSTYNYPDGGIIVLKDKPGQTYPIAHELYIPGEETSNYCMQSIICNSDGTLYYCNDSGYLMALTNDESAVLGDVNLSNTIDTGDAAMVLRHSVSLAEMDRYALRLGDMNIDGQINTGDAAAILRRCVGI